MQSLLWSMAGGLSAVARRGLVEVRVLVLARSVGCDDGVLFGMERVS